MKKLYTWLLVLFIGGSLNAQIFSAGFENNNGTPLSEFKIVNNDGESVPDWMPVPELDEHGWIQFFDGPDNKIAFSTSFYIPEGQSDDWLITPLISIPEEGEPTLYWKAKSYDFENTEDYEIRISVTDDELDSFTEVLMTVTSEQPFDFNARQADLSDYKGQDIHIAFVNVTFNGYYLALDDLYISNSADCELPEISNLTVSNLSEDGFSLSWDASQGISNYAIGLTTFDEPVSSLGEQEETSFTFTDLEPGTRYQFFLKNMDCGSGWAGPHSIYTAIIPPYNYDFEFTEENFGEYDSDGWSSMSWLNSYGADRSQSGEGYLFNNTSKSYDKDDWIYAPPVKLYPSDKLIVSYYAQLGGEVADPATLAVAMAYEQDKSANFEVIQTTVIEAGNDYILLEATFIPEEEGVYYVGFGNVTHVVEIDGPLRIDNVSFDIQPLDVEKFEKQQFVVAPNPVQDFLYIYTDREIESIEVYGLMGKLLYSQLDDFNRVDFSLFADGMYFVKIKGSDYVEMKRIIKN